MDETTVEAACKLVSSKLAETGRRAARARQSLLLPVLSSRRLPERGMDELSIRALLMHLSQMDSNNRIGNVGVGEREGRVYSNLVYERYYGMSHGVGRSGDVAAEQPKAAGSSIMNALCHVLLKDAVRIMGISTVTGVTALPLATGMTLVSVFSALRNSRPGARKVIWSRIDQKTCLKCIPAAGLDPVVVPLIQKGASLHTDVQGIRQVAEELGAANVLCILTTTSCFAPRAPDDVEAVSKIAKELQIPHVINHAYGLQVDALNQAVVKAGRRGRVDAVVCSTDKNFMVPVGGGMIISLGPESEELRKNVQKLYPGRASANAVMDLFITLLQMGKSGLETLMRDRKQNFQHLKSQMQILASEYQEQIPSIPNDISMIMTLSSLGLDKATEIGSRLFHRNISGARAVSGTAVQSVGGINFQGYGSHTDNYGQPYLTVAAAIGGSSAEIDEFIGRVRKVLKDSIRRLRKEQKCKHSQPDVADDIAIENNERVS